MTLTGHRLFTNPHPLSAFLELCKKHYRHYLDDDSKKIHLVLGNESGDLDSVVSSILYAYLLKHENSCHGDALYIPLLNIYREGLSLRKDVSSLFEMTGISSAMLFFLEDLPPLEQLLARDRLRLHLVDHNVLSPKQRHLFSAVITIIDHHADEGFFYPLLTPSRKLIEQVGSSATLIAEKMIASRLFALTPDIAKLLLAPILIDTENLHSIEKTTDREREIAAILKSLASQALPQDFYERLLANKNDTTALTPPMLLSKDFKEYVDGPLLYGISTLPSTVCWEIEECFRLVPQLETYTLERGLTLLIILMANQDHTKLKRKILVYSPYRAFLQAFHNYVQKDWHLSHTLIPLYFAEEKKISFYGTDTVIARKTLQPLFHFTNHPCFKALLVP